ncbi:hypothetical protein ANME2D_02488 [Candidatus Methanoperedens nitroreducens]|uniref:Uncharacterized protein n=1 Tax=Candidatus Methanoperedens nitratireducens TaxID=1392998 RepID=A0A062UW98_9EURY|nr:hypothetical protein [Candidatus Methanoperedens nitroreducens]KCZ71286.1 hypothetical protein ANME2D_02488 [Candidatus Methanoperedens nitroreducens]MDJ1420286.1 hypothetical protein [Candidatus Methanoperedens sp.]
MNWLKKLFSEKTTKGIIEEYKEYRKISKELNHKIIDTCLDPDVFIKAARLLGAARGDTLILDNEDELNILMDFALREYKVNKQNTVEIYREKIGWENDIEKEILDAFISSYTSLFKIISISRAEKSLILEDILNKKGDIKIIDLSLSKTAVPGFLVFIRIIPFKDFNMSAGILFAFYGELEKYLLKKYKLLSKKVKSDSDSVKRFVSFYKLSKTDGIEVRYS